MQIQGGRARVGAGQASSTAGSPVRCGHLVGAVGRGPGAARLHPPPSSPRAPGGGRGREMSQRPGAGRPQTQTSLETEQDGPLAPGALEKGAFTWAAAPACGPSPVAEATQCLTPLCCHLTSMTQPCWSQATSDPGDGDVSPHSSPRTAQPRSCTPCGRRAGAPLGAQAESAASLAPRPRVSQLGDPTGPPSPRVLPTWDDFEDKLPCLLWVGGDLLDRASW